MTQKVAGRTLRRRKKKYGITVNGTYRRDPDETFEFWICADKGERAKHYNMNEFARVFLHEQAHGFERFVYGYDVDLVHAYDYDLKQLPEIFRIMDFTEWNRVQAERDRLLGIKSALLRTIYQKLLNLTQRMDMPVYPVNREYFSKVT